MLNGKDPIEEIAQECITTKVPKLLGYLETLLGDNTYFVGKTLTMADVAITSQMVNYMHGGELIDPNRWPKLSAYYQRMYQQETFQALIAREKRTLDKLLGDRHYNLSPC